MFVQIQSAAVVGVDCLGITAEVDVAGTWPRFQIIGLPDTSIQEAKERIRTAWKNTSLTFPSNARVVINLAPADIRKVGSAYDLPMAVGLFLASYELVFDFSDSLFVGELALDGSVRHTAGILPVVLYAKEHGFKHVYIPAVDVKEAQLVTGIAIHPVTHLQDIISLIQKDIAIPPVPALPIYDLVRAQEHALDMAYIKGQQFAKRALEIVAGGAHNVLLSGPPGSGKTLLARTLPSILPPLTAQEVIEVTKMYSIAGLLDKDQPLMLQRPFRSPHHSASGAALVGGGNMPRPGEISLAHRGVLFLDEFPEFARPVLEHLRQPLEDGIVTVSRAQATLTFPANFTLIASQNPCPCGFASDPEKECVCSAIQIERYKKKVSGPLLDRIDLHLEVPRLGIEKLTEDTNAETSADIRARVIEAQARQEYRFRESTCNKNSDMGSHEVKQFCPLTDESMQFLTAAAKRLQLSGRSFFRIIKVARTIADLAEEEHITTTHLAEALQYRRAE